jgi:hypothetical protein
MELTVIQDLLYKIWQGVIDYMMFKMSDTLSSKWCLEKEIGQVFIRHVTVI